jgi:hypothetical protein
MTPPITSDRVSGEVADLGALLAAHQAAAGALAAADAEAFRQEGPRIDGRIGTLLSLVLGALATSSVIGGVGATLSRQRHAYLAMGLLASSAVVIVAGLVLIVRLILPRLTRVTARSGALAQVAVLPDATAAREHYRAAAQDGLTYQSTTAWWHAVAIAARFRRFRNAGRVLVAGVVLAAAGFLALSWGW